MSNPYSSPLEGFYDPPAGLQQVPPFYLGLQEPDWTIPDTSFHHFNVPYDPVFDSGVQAPTPPTKSRIEMIPSDMFIYLSEYLMLKELIILGLTSRTMWYQCYLQPRIWARQLALICRPQALSPALLLEPWRTSDERPITYIQFAHFCQWPSRFLHAIRRPSKEFGFFTRSLQVVGSTPKPQDGKRSKRKRGDVAIQPVQSTLNLRLLPGGRYLVMADSDKLHVYDLGLRHTQRCAPVASVNLNLPTGFKTRGRPVVEVYNYATAGCDRFRILVIHDSDIDKWSISAFEVGLKESEVHTIQRLPVPAYGRRLGGRLLYAVRDDFLATLSESTLKVWHILGQGSALCWDIGDFRTESKLLTIAVPFTILIIHPDGVHGWKIPESHLQSLEYGSIAPYLPDSPDIIYHLPFTQHIFEIWGQNRSTTDSVTVASANWDFLLPIWHDYNSPLFEGRAAPQVMFEVKTKLVVNRTERLFRWRYSYFMPGPESSNGTLMSTYHYEVPNQWDEGFRYIGVNENYHLLAGYSASHQTGGIVATPMTVYNLPGQDGREENEIKRPHESMFWSVLFKKKEHAEQIVKTMTMCPLTGRICYEKSPYKIGVIDYFCIRQSSDS